MKVIEHTDFIIEEIGEIEDYVYDIEVEDNHNFFGNNILLHNSCYLQVKQPLLNICNKLNIDYETLTFDKKYELIEKYINPKIAEQLKIGFEELAKNLNVMENTFEMKREIIGNKGLWLSKKNYCIKMIDKEGVRKYENDKPYVKGFEIAKKSSTTKWIIDNLTEYLELIFTENKSNVEKFERLKYKEFKTLKCEDMFSIGGIASLDNYTSVTDKGAQARIKGVISYNKIVLENNLEGSYPKINNGDKIRFCYIQEPNSLNSNSIAILDGVNYENFMKFVTEKYKIELDIEKQWNTVFMHPARRLTNAMDWNIIALNKNSLASLLDL
jgi:hypothetical protein